MNKRRAMRFYLLLVVVIIAGCTNKRDDSFSLSVQELPSPAGPGSGEPNLFTASDGRIFLSWLEPMGNNRHVLRFAIREARTWSSPQTIADGQNWFVNWADFPSLVASNRALAAHWLAKSGDGAYAYHVNIAQSFDGGATWSKPIVPHRDKTPTEHGFVSMLPWTNDRFLAIWLDGRNFVAPHSNHGDEHFATEEMTLRGATIDNNGELHDETLLDARVCDCCQTSAALTVDGVIAVYRDRSPEEIRDISIVRFQNGRWTEPRTVYDDGWKHQGCPVNGPAVVAEGKRVAVAWFTMANDTPRVKIAFSNDGAATFDQPIAVDDGNPIGRVDLVLLSQNAALVSWMEQMENDATIRVRRVYADGRRSESVRLAESSTERASGFPQMTSNGSEIVFAWSVPGNPSTLRTAAAKFMND